MASFPLLMNVIVADRRVADGRASSPAVSCPGRISFYFCERARVNVRAKGRAVNSVFLVQLRKMFATDFHG